MSSQPFHSPGPKMETLLLCRDNKTVATLFPLIQGTGAGAQVCSDADLAVEMLARWRFDAVIVDCDEVPNGLDVLRSVRAAPSNRNAVAFALVNNTSVGTAFRLGATLVLSKPIARDEARSALQAAFSLMLLGRRRYHRRPIEVPAMFTRTLGQELRVHTVNISEGGACISAALVPNVEDRGSFVFELPGRPTPIVATAEVMWSRAGRAGLRFEHVLNGGLHSLQEWISESFKQELPHRRISEFA